jgi:antitoxin component YwqK of YwqJK toxin-antitoxin module
VNEELVVDGERVDRYANGTVKAVGHMRDGQLDGAWRWYRIDGSLMRTGQFDLGMQVGQWQTFDRTGRLVKTTTFKPRPVA